MVKIQYKLKTGRKLNLKNPERFSEKLQWYKLYYRNPVMHKCVDKYDVRDYVSSKGLKNILNDIIGIYDNIGQIKFEELPNKFVIKSTNGGGGINVIICKDKTKIDIEETKRQLSDWLSLNSKKSFGREWAYEGNKNRIIIEKLIESHDNKALIDYKFFCFDGKVDYIYAITDRNLGHGAKIGIYDNFFNKLDVSRNDEVVQEQPAKKPKNFEKMVEYAKILSEDFPHARIDFYNLDGKIIFGEITFYDGSGYMTFTPDSFDFELGKNFKLRR